MNRKNYMIIPVLVMAVAFTFAGCSSSGGDGAPGSESAVSIGTMTKGSVIVNGVRFEDTAANITADDTPKTPAFLQDGMTVKVGGRINDDRLTGAADIIEVENEVRGSIESVVGDTITVHSQTVLVDGGTFFANVTPANNLSGLVAGDNVEVHGQRDAAGVIHATRVEELGAGAVDDEIRGVVSSLTGTQFNIGSLVISFGTATIVPQGTALTDGMTVEVHLSAGTNNATRIEIEDLEDDEFRHGAGVEFEVEGLISGFSPGANTFRVGGESVLIDSSTRFEGGLKSELANDVKVEAEGHARSNGALVAEKITFKENIRIEAVAAANGSDALLNLLGLSVKTTSKTEGLAGVATIVAGVDGLRIRGFLNLDGSITATRIDKQSPDSNGRSILQGPALNVNSGSKTVTIAGITITMAPGALSFDDSINADDNVPFASLDDFFAAISSKTMIVKAKGIFSAGSIAASEVEIE